MSQRECEVQREWRQKEVSPFRHTFVHRVTQRFCRNFRLRIQIRSVLLSQCLLHLLPCFKIVCRYARDRRTGGRDSFTRTRKASLGAHNGSPARNRTLPRLRVRRTRPSFHHASARRQWRPWSPFPTSSTPTSVTRGRTLHCRPWRGGP